MVASRKRLIGDSFGWPQGVLTFSLVISVSVGAVVSGLALRENSKAQLNAQVAGGQAGLSWTDTEVSGLTYLDKDLRGTTAQGASIENVDFQGSDLSSSDFRFARFENVNFSGTSLCAVDFRGADLSGAEFLDQAADVNFLLYDQDTTFPEGYDISVVRGPLDTERVNLLYSCSTGTTQLMQLSEEEGT